MEQVCKLYSHILVKITNQFAQRNIDSDKLADTAHNFVKSGGVMDVKRANDIISTSGKVTGK